MKKDQGIIKIVSVSIILAGLMAILLYLDPNPNGKMQLLSYIFLPLWSFSLIPSFTYFYRWISTKSFEQGMKLGVVLRWGIVLIPILIAPYWMVKYYIVIFYKR